MSVRTRYQNLLTDEALLKRLSGHTTWAEFQSVLHTIIAPDEMLQGASSDSAAMFTQIVAPDFTAFTRLWRPTRYNAKNKTLHWSLRQSGRPDEPFFDDYIAKLNGTGLLAAIIKPQTSLQYLLDNACRFPTRNRVNFIFHQSRCGSTLLANFYARQKDCFVVSEAQLCTEILLDGSLRQQQKACLLNACLSLFTDPHSHLVVKLNAWDIACFELLINTFAGAKSIFLTRDPIEILASHQKQAGIHMARADDRIGTLLSLTDTQDLFQWQLTCLKRIRDLMCSVSHNDAVWMLDYEALLTTHTASLLRYFALPCDDENGLIAQDKNDAKQPGKAFMPDSQKKQHMLTRQQKQQIAYAFQNDTALSAG